MSGLNDAAAFDGLAAELRRAVHGDGARVTLLRRMSWRRFETRVRAARVPARHRLRYRRGRHSPRQPRASRGGHRCVVADDSHGQAQGRARRMRASRPISCGCPWNGSAPSWPARRFDGDLFELRRHQLRRQTWLTLARELAPLLPAGCAAGVGGHGPLRAMGMGLVPGAWRCERRLPSPAPRRRRVARAYRALSDARAAGARAAATLRAARRHATGPGICRAVMPLHICSSARRDCWRRSRAIEAAIAAPAHAGGASPITTSSRR